MAYIFGLIARLLHCARAGKSRLTTYSAGVPKEAAMILQGHPRRAGRFDYSGRRVFTAVAWSVAKSAASACFFRRRMHPVKKRDFSMLKDGGPRPAGRDHELFGSICGRRFLSALRTPVMEPSSAKLYCGSGRVKVQGSAFLSHPGQDFSKKLVGVPEHLADVWSASRRGFPGRDFLARVIKNAGHLHKSVCPRTA